MSSTMADVGGDGDGELLARVEDLHLHFETRRGVVKALNGVSFDIHQGETMTLVGETGCGKSITSRSFMQLVPCPPGFYPDGRVLFRSDQVCGDCSGDGCDTCYDTGFEFIDLLTLSPQEMRRLRGTEISMVFQDPSDALNPSLTIRNQVAESIFAARGGQILEKAGISRDQANSLQGRVLRAHASPDQTRLVSAIASIPPLRKYKKRIKELLDEEVIELLRTTQISSPAEVATKYPFQLSGGMQQRVMIAMALVAEPSLLIADEPTTALDVTIQKRIIELLDDLQTEFNTSLLYVTHDLGLVRTIADRIGVMYAGSMAEIAPTEKLYSSPLHPYTQGLLNSIPNAEKVGGSLEGIGGTLPDMTNPPTGCRFCTRCPEELDHCATDPPPVIEEEEDHYVACHLYPADGESTSQSPGEATAHSATD